MCLDTYKLHYIEKYINYKQKRIIAEKHLMKRHPNECDKQQAGTIDFSLEYICDMLFHKCENQSDIKICIFGHMHHTQYYLS